MSYPSMEFLPKSSSKLASKQRGTTRTPLPLSYGATNVAPSSSSSSLTILVYNTLAIAISTNCMKPSSHTTLLPKIGKAPYVMVLISNGAIPNECDTYQWMDMSRTSYIAITMHPQRNPSYLLKINKDFLCILGSVCQWGQLQTSSQIIGNQTGPSHCHCPTILCTGRQHQASSCP